jgi:CHAT domain-containing protein
VSVFGGYGSGGGESMPRVLGLSVRAVDAGRFQCSLHEEGTGLAWEYPARVSDRSQARLVEDTRTLHAWSIGRESNPARARRAVDAIGRQLHRSFLGSRGEEYLGRMEPTAVLLNVDETILSLPWELMHGAAGPLVTDVPVGRVVATRIVPHAERDPLAQDREVRILAVADPTADLALADAEVEAMRRVVGHGAGGYNVHLDVLEGDEATRARFRSAVAETSYDILHFAGHAGFAKARPGQSPLHFADGEIRADEVLSLPWSSPPGIVFASACESATAAHGARLVGRRRNSNGLAAAFLSAGVAGYLGYLWPVTDEGAGLVSGAFYDGLFQRENVGLAVLEARRAAASRLSDPIDLAAFSLVLYGDAASKHRRDLATAA